MQDHNMVGHSASGKKMDDRGKLGWKDLAKVVGASMALRMTWQAYEKSQNFSWKDATDSAAYQHWLKFCRMLVRSGFVPTYAPENEHGERGPLQSQSMQVHAVPPISLENAKVMQPMKIRNLTIRNRIVRAAAFDGEREEEMIQTHVEQSMGGVGMTTVAYCCIADDGKTFDGQLVMSEDRREFLKTLTEKVHEHGAAISAQLTHGGSFADREACGGKQQIAPSRKFNPAGLDFPKTMSRKDCDRIADDFARAAKLAKETGFDCIELHCGHGYLLSQFLSPASNQRTDKYGGSAENRAEFPAECLRRCRKAVGEEFPIIVKLNMQDGVYGGLEVRDAAVAANILADNSADAFVMTGGFVSQNAFFMLRGATPQERLVQALPHTWKKIGMMIFGPLAVPSIEYEDCFFRDGARYMLKALNNRVPVCLMGGVNTFAEMEGAMQEGFGFVQIARALIREPDLPNRIEATLRLKEEGTLPQVEEDIQSSCIRCNMCVIATVDPSAVFGCPFQRNDAKKRQAKGLPPVLSVKQMQSEILLSRSISVEPTFGSDLQDIEDLVASSARGAKM